MTSSPQPSTDRLILDALQAHGDWLAVSSIAANIEGAGFAVPRRTLQAALARMVDENMIARDGAGRGVRYRTSGVVGGDTGAAIPFTPEARDVLALVRRSINRREPVGYDQGFLDCYQPGVTWYLSSDERSRLAGIGLPLAEEAPAGTYARQVLGRLLIDLAWNSSRLEGSTYSLLETERLIAFGAMAEGRTALEAQMILNHKDAIEFLVDGADEARFNRSTIQNLHALLSNNLLPDPAAVGRLRSIPVGIGGSVFAPLELPQRIEACFDTLLAKAAAISDPYEQALFVLVQIPYLQPFDDVNKRVSRLAANIPLIRANLPPLSFTDVPGDDYLAAMLAVYELNRIEPLKELFIWACERSAARYRALRQTIGEPDPFRMRYRAALIAMVAGIINASVPRAGTPAALLELMPDEVRPEDRDALLDLALKELQIINDGNFARYRVRPSSYRAWAEAWGRRSG